MKLYVMLVVLVGVLSIQPNLSSYQIHEDLLSDNDSNEYEAGHDPVRFEKRTNGSDSKVFLINGLNHYKRFILEQSLVKPLVVKVFSNKSSESRRVIDHFHALADHFGDRVGCIALDLFATYDGSNQNYQIIMELMSRIKLNKLDLPTFIFYDKGRMILPIDQGFYTKENLISLVNGHFF